MNQKRNPKAKQQASKKRRKTQKDEWEGIPPVRWKTIAPGARKAIL